MMLWAAEPQEENHSGSRLADQADAEDRPIILVDQLLAPLGAPLVGGAGVATGTDAKKNSDIVEPLDRAAPLAVTQAGTTVATNA